MAVNVVLEVPAAGAAARFGRRMAVLAGSVMMLLGVLAAPFTAVFAFLATASYAGWDPVTEAEDEQATLPAVLWGLFAFVLAVLFIWLGLRLIRGRRRLGLYLRKFGYGDATRAVTRTLTTSVGRRVRVVTLDDAMVAPVGVDTTRRRVAALTCAVFTGLTAWAIVWVATGGIDRVVADAVASTAPEQPEAENVEESIESAATSIFTAGIVAGIVAFLVLAAIAIATLLAASVAVLAASAYVSALVAGRLATRTIDDEAAIGPTARKLLAASRRVFSPRLFVVRVADRIWPQAVRALGGAADLVVLDVSHPTGPLLWEVQTMKPLVGDRWVLVGAYEHVQPLTDPRAAVGDDLRAQLARLLDGETILAYGHTPADHRRFGRSLRNLFHRAAAPRPATA